MLVIFWAPRQIKELECQSCSLELQKPSVMMMRIGVLDWLVDGRVPESWGLVPEAGNFTIRLGEQAGVPNKNRLLLPDFAALLPSPSKNVARNAHNSTSCPPGQSAVAFNYPSARTTKTRRSAACFPLPTFHFPLHTVHCPLSAGRWPRSCTTRTNLQLFAAAGLVDFHF